MIITQQEIKDVVPEAYLPFSAYVIQTRALPDVRDFLKTGGRYILWSQYFDKNTYKEKRKKAADAVGRAMHWNPHGDAGIYTNLVRFAKPFAMRYLLEDTKGNVGTITKGKDHTASRYLEIRSSKIAAEFTSLIKKNTVEHWKRNYTNEHDYPEVFPTLFPNFVNGNTGIGVGCISSTPPYNLNEAVASLKKLVENPNVSFDEIYIEPDFPTGGVIINQQQVKESLKNGEGSAVKIRAVINYNENTNTLEVVQLPYQVFTNGICEQIAKGIEEGTISGIKSFNDSTDRSCKSYECLIEIQLNKGVNPQRVCRQLYKETDLQSSYTIKQLVLENGVVPKLYGQQQIMQAFLDHSMSCLKKAYQFDYDNLNKAITANEGFLIAVANIDDIISIIKNADSDEIIYQTFSEKYGLSETQTKSILDLKLQKLRKMESIKIEKELAAQKAEQAKIGNILQNKDEFKNAYLAELDRIASEYGDSRRTKVINLDFTSEDDDAEPIEQKELLIHYTNLGNIYTQESTTLMKTRRGGKGSKIKMSANETVTKTISDSNLNSLLAFSNKGKMYSLPISDLPINTKINIKQLFELERGESITALTSMAKHSSYKYLVFLTKQGMIKKTAINEYNLKRGKSLKAINLKDNDEVINVFPINSEQVGILTNCGNYVIINTQEINVIGRASQGVRAIKLSDNDFVLAAQPIKTTDKFLVTISEKGLIKKSLMSEYPPCTRGTKGKKVSGVQDGDKIVKVLTFEENNDIIIISQMKVIKISTADLRELSRTAVGVKAIDISEHDKIMDMVGEIND